MPSLRGSGVPAVARRLPHAGAAGSATRSAITFESWPPCQASGERPGSSDDEPRAGDPRRVALADARSGCPGSASSRLGHDDGRRRRCARSSSQRSNGRERGTARSASATRVGVLVGGQALAQDRRAPSRATARARRARRRPRRTPRRRPRAARRASASQRVESRRVVGPRGRRPGVMTTSPATRSGCSSAKRSSVCAPIDAPASTARSIAAVVEHRAQVGGEVGVAVGPGSAPGRTRRGRGRRRRPRGGRRARARASP